VFSSTARGLEWFLLVLMRRHSHGPSAGIGALAVRGSGRWSHDYSQRVRIGRFSLLAPAFRGRRRGRMGNIDIGVTPDVTTEHGATQGARVP
jgi:hypothetical protein